MSFRIINLINIQFRRLHLLRYLKNLPPSSSQYKLQDSLLSLSPTTTCTPSTEKSILVLMATYNFNFLMLLMSLTTNNIQLVSNQEAILKQSSSQPSLLFKIPKKMALEKPFLQELFEFTKKIQGALISLLARIGLAM
jgi:hypothetical protein